MFSFFVFFSLCGVFYSASAIPQTTTSIQKRMHIAEAKTVRLWPQPQTTAIVGHSFTSALSKQRKRSMSNWSLPRDAGGAVGQSRHTSGWLGKVQGSVVERESHGNPGFYFVIFGGSVNGQIVSLLVVRVSCRFSDSR